MLTYLQTMYWFGWSCYYLLIRMQYTYTVKLTQFNLITIKYTIIVLKFCIIGVMFCNILGVDIGNLFYKAV